MAALLYWVRQALMVSTSVLALVSSIVCAQSNTRVTADQVAAAIMASPNASSQLRGYADAIGSLAMFESGGRLDVYNGSCCYGILQMTGTNIRDTLHISTEQFRNLPLQDQVNAWATVMSQALRTSAPAQLAAMTTFDGRPVTPSMVLACVQLGVGNCLTMIRSGRCEGFNDRNGTSICEMADRIDGVTRPPVTNPSPSPTPGTGWTLTPQTPNTALQNCLTDGYGNCMSISAAVEAGFENGSGVSMSQLRNTIQMLTVAITFLICASMLLAMWRQYADGRIATADLWMGVRQVSMVASIILIVLTVA
ncbi:DUF3262 family protein [Hydrogenophaga sp. NFH-34]|uniref:DUF3262 family protein n=1 Tax=Hydrogenophaga sp. NFH-34 TaxID=2744446 RepID=UPI001F290AB4|nr:DUF3262 family protein [Hydrogenophaga sp. NFH-34]